MHINFITKRMPSLEMPAISFLISLLLAFCVNGAQGARCPPPSDADRRGGKEPKTSKDLSQEQYAPLSNEEVLAKTKEYLTEDTKEPINNPELFWKMIDCVRIAIEHAERKADLEATTSSPRMMHVPAGMRPTTDMGKNEDSGSSGIEIDDSALNIFISNLVTQGLSANSNWREIFEYYSKNSAKIGDKREEYVRMLIWELALQNEWNCSAYNGTLFIDSASKLDTRSLGMQLNHNYDLGNYYNDHGRPCIDSSDHSNPANEGPGSNDAQGLDKRCMPLRKRRGKYVSYTNVKIGNIQIQMISLPKSGRLNRIFSLIGMLSNGNHVIPAEIKMCMLKLPFEKTFEMANKKRNVVGITSLCKAETFMEAEAAPGILDSLVKTIRFLEVDFRYPSKDRETILKFINKIRPRNLVVTLNNESPSKWNDFYEMVDANDIKITSDLDERCAISGDVEDGAESKSVRISNARHGDEKVTIKELRLKKDNASLSEDNLRRLVECEIHNITFEHLDSDKMKNFIKNDLRSMRRLKSLRIIRQDFDLKVAAAIKGLSVETIIVDFKHSEYSKDRSDGLKDSEHSRDNADSRASSRYKIECHPGPGEEKKRDRFIQILGESETIKNLIVVIAEFQNAKLDADMECVRRVSKEAIPGVFVFQYVQNEIVRI